MSGIAMDLRPLNYFEPDELCKFEMLGLTNATMVPVMITMTPAVAVEIQKQQQQQHQRQLHPNNQPPPIPQGLLSGTTITGLPMVPSQFTPAGIPVLPANISQEKLKQLEMTSSGGGMIFQKSDCRHHYQHHPHHPQQQQQQQHQQQEHQGTFQTKAHFETRAPFQSISSSCIPTSFSRGGDRSGCGINAIEGGSLVGGGCGTGCTALMMIGIGGGSSGNSARSQTEDDCKQPCNCTYMSFDNFADYQTSGFGGLPDVTEHSNTRRSITHQDSNTNSESADAASIQKTKKQVTPSPSKRKYCIFSLSIVTTLILFAAASIMVYQFVLLAPSRNSHDQRLKIVHKVLKEIPLIDGHNNLAWNIRKYAHNSLELFDLSQELEQKTIWHRPVWSQTDIPRLKQGLVGAQIWSAYVPCEAQGLDAVQLALEQIDIIHRFAELHPKELSLVTSSQEILTAHHKGRLASLIGIEGGHALGSSLGVLRSMHSLGARYLTLANQCDTSWAGSSSMSMEKGLSSFGKAVIKEMNRLGMMIDLSHSSDTTARDVLEVTRAPVIFSNSAARSICNSSRNVPDDILRAVADNGGLIMIGFDSQHVSCDESSTLHHVIAHIKYIRSIAGIQHIGIGARFDGIETPPVGLEDVSKYPNLFATLLEDTNWSEDDIGMLAGMNFLRVLKSVENVRDYWKRAAIAPVEITEPIKKSQCTYMSS